MLLNTGLPYPSRELGHGAQAKARRATRQAGFTEPANTSQSWQWKDYGPVQLRPNKSSDWLALSDHHLFIRFRFRIFSRPIFLFSICLNICT
ncbi:hypothetical protein RHGRI_017646 [Rhododendron griersonianum]|uniref:Uncharacterized protein n=1 Tax=Rhododendron griersonianum TaxID=479676 RepID=A0AAV6JYQ6_9ERIC|nr:hypothetical protein RHGRI_017646 [Rhododendron griersonianum]